MSRCDLLEGCIFFNDKMHDYPFAADQMKQQYCMEGSEDCARFTVREALGKERVPVDLFPHDIERAQRIVDGTDVRTPGL
jgi:hypothetical protein